jgi:hypothetical protein
MLCVKNNYVGMVGPLKDFMWNWCNESLTSVRMMTSKIFNNLLNFLEKISNLECLWNQLIWTQWPRATTVILPSIPRRKWMSNNWYQHWCGRPSIQNIKRPIWIISFKKILWKFDFKMHWKSWRLGLLMKMGVKKWSYNKMKKL